MWGSRWSQALIPCAGKLREARTGTKVCPAFRESKIPSSLPVDECLGPQYERLSHFLKSVASTGAHTARTTFGPGASYFSMAHSGYSWQNIPPALEDDIHRCMKIRRPTCVALGVHGSYVVLYNDGTASSDLRGQYPLVETILRNPEHASRRRGLMVSCQHLAFDLNSVLSLPCLQYVALNPFVPGEFYAVYGDGGTSWNFPISWTEDVTAVSREIRPVGSPVSAVSAGGTVPRQAAPVAKSISASPGRKSPVSDAERTPMPPPYIPHPPAAPFSFPKVAPSPVTSSPLSATQRCRV